jgi:zinc transport system substrate-binding protein
MKESVMRGWRKAMAWSLLLTGCSGDKSVDRTEVPATRPLVFATNYPLLYFAERISKPMIDVRIPMPAGADPSFWNPTPEDISALQRADLIVINGASYETWLSNVSLPESRLVNTSEGFHEQLIPQEQALTHRHGPEGEHEHSATASTTWLDLVLAVEQARAIQWAFAKRWPMHRGQFELQFKQLALELESLDAELSPIAQRMAGMPILFSHPVYQYLARRFQLDGRSLPWDPTEMPSESMWQELTQLLHSHPAKWMIWEATPAPEIRAKLTSLGIESIVFDPCDAAPKEGDFATVMKSNIDSLKRVVRE